MRDDSASQDNITYDTFSSEGKDIAGAWLATHFLLEVKDIKQNKSKNRDGDGLGLQPGSTVMTSSCCQPVTIWYFP